jgi:hypothetical protein
MNALSGQPVPALLIPEVYEPGCPREHNDVPEVKGVGEGVEDEGAEVVEQVIRGQKRRREL